jgi:maltooligosyltrehalose synthase
MKFNREHLEELTLQKIKEVNDEAGYRKYLEVPEMVNIIASIMEEKMQVFHDSDAKLIQILRDDVKKLDEENEALEQIIYDTLRELPVGNISTHTPESIPERVGHWVRESAEECRLREQWEACADNLVDYAHEFVQNLSAWGKGYDRYDKDIKKAEDAIEEHKRLKNET